MSIIAKYKVGDKVNQFTVIEKLNSERDTRGYLRSKFLCKCECGKIKSIRTDQLERTLSCGCIRIQRWKERKGKTTYKILSTKDGIRNILYSNYQTRAEYKKLHFNLTIEEFQELIFNNCHYCNRSPYQKIYNKYTKEYTLYIGIDRINSQMGYIKDNCVSCCKICNYGKRNLTQEEWYNHIKLLVSFWKDKI